MRTFFFVLVEKKVTDHGSKNTPFDEQGIGCTSLGLVRDNRHVWLGPRVLNSNILIPNFFLLSLKSKEHFG